MKTFIDILQGLSTLVGEDLQPDANQACVLVLNEQMRIQLELDASGEFLILGCMVVDLPPGKFRENILKAALKENALVDKGPGIFAFIARANKLVLWDKIHTSEISPENLLSHITSLFHRADNWKNAVQGGRISPN